VDNVSLYRSTSGKELLPLVQEGEWAWGPVWTGTENPAHTGFEPWTGKPVACHYTLYPLPQT